MESVQVKRGQAELVVERLWRAYAPYQRGRNTTGDLASMLAILLLARFMEWAEAGTGLRDDPMGEAVRRWRRALAEARIGMSPLGDLRAVMRIAVRDDRFPVPDLVSRHAEAFDDDGGSDDVPWMAAFVSALDARPSPEEAGFAEVAERLVERHVDDDTLSAGEFHTPRAVARLIVDLASLRPGDRVLDPACGTGGILAAAARLIAGPDGVQGDSFEAYATDRSNTRLATMNLAVHGVHRPVVRASDRMSFSRLWSNDRVDHVVSNPPFNQRIEDLNYRNWPFGLPPAKGNFAWLQLAWSRLAEDGTAVVVMPAGAGSSLSSREAGIRRAMVDSGALLGVVALPSELFTHTSVAVHLWVLARDVSRLLPPGEADSVLFIDAGRLGTRAPRRPRLLSPNDVAKISGRLHEWLRSPRSTPDEHDFSCSVEREQILAQGCGLDPRQYVDRTRETPTAEHDPGRLLDELEAQQALVSAASAALRESFTTLERLAGAGAGTEAAPQSTPLRVLAAVPLRGVAGTTPVRERLFAGPSGSLIRAEDYVDDDGVPVVMPRDLTGGRFSEAAVKLIPYEMAERLDRFRLQPGDVVLARRGELGRCAVARAEQRDWICGTGCFVLRPPAELDPDYFAAYLRSPVARAWLDAHSTGSLAMRTISRDALRELPVALPDLRTQRAIADMMARFDEQELLVRRQLDLTRDTRQDMLNKLFAG